MKRLSTGPKSGLWHQMAKGQVTVESQTGLDNVQFTVPFALDGTLLTYVGALQPSVRGSGQISGFPRPQ